MKNNSFKYTFYFGLLIILIVCALITSVSINIYKTVYNNNRIKKEKIEVIETPVILEKEIIHDTLFIERPKPINVSTPKKETKIIKLIQPKKIDTTSFNDSVIK
jgi:hypothetical protein